MATESIQDLQAGPEKKGLELRILQAEHSEYLYKRENEIQDKIELEQQLTTEERDLFWMRKVQHLQDALDRIVQNSERY